MSPQKIMKENAIIAAFGIEKLLACLEKVVDRQQKN